MWPLSENLTSLHFEKTPIKMHWIKNAYHKNILTQIFNPLVIKQWNKAPIEKTKEPTDFSLNCEKEYLLSTDLDLYKYLYYLCCDCNLIDM